MTWTKIPDDWIEVIEAVDLSREAERMHLRALVYCNKAGNDGHLGKAGLRRIGLGFRNVSALTTELCEKFGWIDDAEGGFHVPFDDQETAEVVRKRKALSAERNRRYRRRGLEMRAERDASRDASRDVTPSSPDRARAVPAKGKAKGQGENLSPTGRAGALPPSPEPRPSEVDSVMPDLPVWPDDIAVPEGLKL